MIKQHRTEPSFIDTLSELQGGTVLGVLDRMIADTAMATAEKGDAKIKGKVTIELTMTAAKANPMLLQIAHRATYTHPTARGRKTEEVGDEQTMFVNAVGALTTIPDTQESFDFTSTEEK